MDIIQTKVLVAILFGIIRLAFGILPIQICSWCTISNEKHGIKVITESKCKTLDFAIAKMQSFGGGVLFATCLLHMMPEVYYSVEELRNFGILHGHYPYSQLVICFGFFLVYFMEELSHWIIAQTPQEPCNKRKDDSRNAPVYINITNENDGLENLKERKLNVNGTGQNNRDKMLNKVNEQVQTEDQNDVNFDEELNMELEVLMDKNIKTKQQILRYIFIVAALSLHAILEGLAIGLQHSIKNIWYLFTAVSIHSATVLFSVGLEIFTAGITVRRMIIHMFFLALTSPVGVLLGLTISLTTDTHTSAKSFAVVFLEGLSAGALLYITFFEILIREKERRVCRIKRALSIVAGFAMMAGLECTKFLN